jgi:hypothetical protein
MIVLHAAVDDLINGRQIMTILCHWELWGGADARGNYHGWTHDLANVNCDMCQRIMRRTK